MRRSGRPPGNTSPGATPPENALSGSPSPASGLRKTPAAQQACVTATAPEVGRIFHHQQAPDHLCVHRETPVTALPDLPVEVCRMGEVSPIDPRFSAPAAIHSIGLKTRPARCWSGAWRRCCGLWLNVCAQPDRTPARLCIFVMPAPAYAPAIEARIAPGHWSSRTQWRRLCPL